MDDLSNHWGCNLVALGREQGKRKRTGKVLDDYTEFTKFRNIVSKNVGEDFRLEVLLSCGSQSNLYAISSLTDGDTTRCLTAAGSYVSGNRGPLQSWSTSAMSPRQDSPCRIMLPDEVKKPFTVSHTTPLPYHIPGTMPTTDLDAYESKCMAFLHERCLVAKMRGSPILGLFLELCLAGNGAVLSDTALHKIGLLAAHHGFKLIVDEIMTGGRTATMLMSTVTPASFRSNIAYITMGKWMKCGVVIVSEAQYELCYDQHGEGRGASTTICSQTAARLWETVSAELSNIDTRRQTVLSKLKVESNEAWGKGILIFANVKKSGYCKGLKCRVLPMITQTPVDTTKILRKQSWTQHWVNTELVSSVEAWCDHRLYMSKGLQDNDEGLYGLAHSLGYAKPDGVWHTTAYLVDSVFSKRYSDKQVCSFCRAAVDAGLLEHVQKSRERRRGWQVKSSMILPWQNA